MVCESDYPSFTSASRQKTWMVSFAHHDERGYNRRFAKMRTVGFSVLARNYGVLGQTAAIFPHVADPAAAVDNAVREAFSEPRRAAAA